MITRRFECTTGGHNKFWEVSYPDGYEDGLRRWSTRWGRIGTDGQEKEFLASSAYYARNAAQAKIDEKIRKGYRETFASAVRPHLAVPITQTVPYISPRSGRRATHNGREVDPAENRKRQTASTQPSALTGGMDISKPKRRKIVLE